MLGEPLRYERRFALLGALVTLGEVAGVGAPLAVYFQFHRLSEAERPLLLRAAPVVFGGAWLIWWLAVRWWRGPLDRAVRGRLGGVPVDGETVRLATRVTALLPLRAGILRAAMATVAALGLALLLYLRAGSAPLVLATGVAITVLHSLVVAVFRVLAWSRLLRRVRAALVPDADPLAELHAVYRRRLARAGIATAALGASIVALFILVFMRAALEGFLRLELYSPLVLAPLAALFLGLVYQLTAPIETYLRAATHADPKQHPTREDPRGLAAHRAAQKLPYQLGAAKLVIAVVGEAVLAFEAIRWFGIAREYALPVFAEAFIVTVGAALYDVLWHRATLRPLLAHLAARHRPDPDSVRSPFGVRARMLLFLGVLTLFAGTLSLLAANVQQRAAATDSAPTLAVLAFFSAVLLGASMGIVVLIAEDVARPIRRLEERAAAMARGDLNRPVSHVAGEADEVGRLTIAFEEMRRALNEKFRSSTEINLALESEVTRRTAELERRNKELADALDALRRAQDELVRSEKMASMGRLVAGIAHEINNPVNAIVNTVGPLEASIEEVIAHAPAASASADQPATHALPLAEVAGDAREMIRVIRSGARRTKEIVQALHNYSRGDEDSLVQVDLHRGIDESLELLRHHLKHGIKVERTYGAVGRVMGNAGQLQQVFMNLLTNAAQAISDRAANGGPAGGTIRIATERAGDRVVIRVSDDGPGIPEAALPRIFDPFFTTKDVGEGSGLGLSIVHGIVERHGGTISVESQVGKGTTFTVALPADSRAGAPPAARAN